MNKILTLLCVFSFSLPALSINLTGDWELSKLVCASGETPLSNWEPWRVLLRFDSPNYYTIIRQREEFTSFETGEYFNGDINQVCFKNDFNSNAPVKCYDVLLEDRDLRFGEYMQTDADCAQGDYAIRYFLPQAN